MAPILTLNSQTFFFLHIYSLRYGHTDAIYCSRLARQQNRLNEWLITKLTVDEQFDRVTRTGGLSDAAYGHAYKLFPVVVLGGVEAENVNQVRPSISTDSERRRKKYLY
jgi:hypothetical protein